MRASPPRRPNGIKTNLIHFASLDGNLNTHKNHLIIYHLTHSVEMAMGESGRRSFAWNFAFVIFFFWWQYFGIPIVCHRTIRSTESIRRNTIFFVSVFYGFWLLSVGVEWMGMGRQTLQFMDSFYIWIEMRTEYQCDTATRAIRFYSVRTRCRRRRWRR